LKLQYDGLLSNFAFKFNLRRYIEGNVTMALSPTIDYVQTFSGTVLCDPAEDLNVVGRCRLTL